MDKMDLAAYATMEPVHNLHGEQGRTQPGMQRASPKMMANVMLFLVSDASQEISGAIIPVDHAWSTI